METITFHGEITATDVMPLDQEVEVEEMMMVRLQQHSVSALIWSESDSAKFLIRNSKFILYLL